MFEDQIEFIVDQYLAGDRVVSYCCWLWGDHLHDRQPIPSKGALWYMAGIMCCGAPAARYVVQQRSFQLSK